MSEQCVVCPDGKLLDAKDIKFYNDPDGVGPIGAPFSRAAPTSIKNYFGPAPRRSTRVAVPSARTIDVGFEASAGAWQYESGLFFEDRDVVRSDHRIRSIIFASKLASLFAPKQLPEVSGITDKHSDHD
jgi:hypothetical protein